MLSTVSMVIIFDGNSKMGKEQYLLFDLPNAFDEIKSSHESYLFSPKTPIFAVVLLCQRTNCKCDNLPTFVLQNSGSVTRNFAVQMLANCYIDSLFFERVKPSPIFFHAYTRCSKLPFDIIIMGWIIYIAILFFFFFYCYSRALTLVQCPIVYESMVIVLVG